MNQDNKKTSCFIFSATFFFSLVRAVIFSTEDLIGYNFDKKQTIFTNDCVLFWLFILLYSLLSAAFVAKTYKNHGNKFWIPCILLVADPVFLINQKHLSVLLIYVLWLFYLNSYFIKSNKLKTLTAFLFLFVSAVISTKTVLGFLPLVLLTESLPTIDKEKSPRTYITRFLIVAVTISGIVLNKLFTSNIPEFKSFTDCLSTEQFVQSEKIIAVLLLSIPSLISGVLFICIFTKKYIIAPTTKKKAPKRKNSDNATLNIICSALVLLFAVSVFGGYETLCTLSWFMPVIILVLLSTDNARADSALTDMNNFILSHSAASVSILALVYYLCLRFYLAQFGGYIVADFFLVNR